MSNNNTNNLETTKPPHTRLFKIVEDGGESCCMAGKSNCCISATIRFLLDGRDGGGSGIGGIVRMVVMMVALYWW